jgi:hypothetical protein
VKDDCTFGGWACGLQVYQPGQSVTLTGDVTVKAIWNAAEDGGDSAVDKAKDVIDEVIDFVKTHVFESVIILILVILAVLFILSRRRRY